MRIKITAAFLLLIFSCKNEVSKIDEIGQKVNLKYAEGFAIEEFKDHKVITLKDAWRGEKTTYKYVLFKDEIPKGYKDAVKIKVPIKSIACMSLTHIAFIEALGEVESLVAISGGKHSHNNNIKLFIESNKVAEIGSERSINYEVLLERNPNLIMAYGIDGASSKYTDKFESLGLTNVLNAEYMEVHPLGKAEWIKFVAEFYDKSDIADSIFNSIEASYNDLVNKTNKISKKPTVFVGMPWNGNWYVAGGGSFQAQLFKDAGAHYIWGDNNEKSSVVKSKEVVYNDALNADLWLNVNSYNSLGSIIAYDERLANFSAIKDTMVYNNDKRVNEFMGNDYWESGTLNPHIILKDLIEIIHPDVLNHELYYYRKLN